MVYLQILGRDGVYNGQQKLQGKKMKLDAEKLLEPCAYISPARLSRIETPVGCLPLLDTVVTCPTDGSNNEI